VEQRPQAEGPQAAPAPAADHKYSAETVPITMAARLPPGQLGTKTILLSNFFNINFRPKTVYRYKVEIEPPIDADKVAERRSTLVRMGKELDARFGLMWSFDGNSILSLDKVTDVVTLAGEHHRAVISLSKEIDTKDTNREEVQAVGACARSDVVLGGEYAGQAPAAQPAPDSVWPRVLSPSEGDGR
jgi:hypothetical protein